MPQNDENAVKTTARSLDIIEMLRELNGARLTEIADAVGLPNSTVHNHLSTLLERGYVVKQGHQYHVGLRFLDFGEYARRTREAYLPAQDELDQLAAETGQTAFLLTEENGVGVVLYVSRADGAVPVDLRPGNRLPLHSSGVGQAYMAYLSDEKIDEIVDRFGLPERTESTISEPAELHDTLAEVRERGIAVEVGGRLPGVTSIGTAIKDESGTIVAAIGIAGAGGSFDDVDGAIDHVKHTANVIDLRIAHS
ncbi:IclR family transcriptional regulator [Natrialba swarupiae]|uniref:IclR family transcriptional regulator n=1 Tax=Natrialba swarupiae TaxID=2448032 RepID=A0A5D5AL19_9EURY|nr:IclR family transcriptional regulator [Natrialba swarupiae]TYT61673.1 IclR family transcriptional regulator [Natrialba swarupiae]